MPPHRFLIILLLAIVLGPLAYAADGSKRPAAPLPITIAKDTTHITSPLREDGYPDYVGALEADMRKGVTPQNNVTVVLLEVVGPSEIGADSRDEYFRRLGIPVLPDDGDYLESFYDYLARTVREDDEQRETLSDSFDSAQDRPWTAEQSPVVARWLAEQEKHLDRMVAASRRSHYYSPLLTSDDGESAMLVAVMLPTISEFREVARALAARAMLRAGQGDRDGAWQDLMACFRLGRLAAQGATLIDSLVSIAVDRLAWKGMIALAHSDQLTAAQIKRIRADVAALPAPAPMIDKIDRAERYMFLDSVCTLQRMGPKAISALAGSDGEDPRVMKFSRHATNAMVDWNEVLRMGNRFYDRLVAAVRNDDAKAYERLENELKQMFRVSKAGMLGAPLLALGGASGKRLVSRQMGGMLIGLFMPAFGSARAAERRDTAQMRLADMALCLAAYHLDHGGFPASLEDLVPRYAAKLPTDPFGDAAFRYRRTDHGYLLYSLGRNVRDDHGRTREDDYETDDIVVRTPAAN